jgi:glycosyltransferase involved in cell wall biosynthesis
MRTLYLQPYVPHYRVPLFDQLDTRLRAIGGRLTVACAEPENDQRARADNASGPWLREVRGRSWRTPVGEFKHRAGTQALIANADVCVMELDAGNVNAWLHVARRHRPPLVLWGHGKSFVSSRPGISDRMRRLLAGAASHVMTYSPAGREHLIAGGLPQSRVTCVGNATDTIKLRRLLDRRLERPLHQSEAFGLDITGRDVACYVGGLDRDKRVPFLVSAAREAHRLDPRFVLLVAGSGVDQHLVQAAGEAIQWRAHASAEEMADLAAVSRSIWMPGRVGLIAVDALALGRPVLTTAFPFHAPEYEFLTPGRTVHELPDEPAAFAREASALHRVLPSLPSPAERATPTVESVAQAMVDVLRATVKREASAWA